jgi:hypothetical protein
LREYTLARTLNKKLFAVAIDPTKSIADLPPELKGTWQAVELTGGQDGVLLPTQLPGSHEEKHVVFFKDGLRRLKRGLDKAPAGTEPVRRDEEDHRLAAVGLLVQRPLPALARRDASLRVEIEEDVVPALAREPVA